MISITTSFYIKFGMLEGYIYTDVIVWKSSRNEYTNLFSLSLFLLSFLSVFPVLFFYSLKFFYFSLYSLLFPIYLLYLVSSPDKLNCVIATIVWFVCCID